MPPLIKPEARRLGVACIFKQHIADYQNQYPLWWEHRKIVYDLINCRTEYLGGHIDRCDQCGAIRITYHSCRNRHCPTCQHMPRERWLEQRKREILPTRYFHVVFTLPHTLNPIVLNNKKVMLTILFQSASRTLSAFGKNTLGGQGLGRGIEQEEFDLRQVPCGRCGIQLLPAAEQDDHAHRYHRPVERRVADNAAG